MATPQLDFDPWEDGTPAPAGHGAPAAGKTQAIDFDPWADGPARTAANDSTPAKVPGSEDKPGFLRTGWEALKRGGASAIASTAHTVADTIDQVVQAPVRQVMGALGQATKADPAAVRAFEDPLGARAVADENLGVAREIDADRQAVAERIGPRPGMADWRAHPGDAARSTALRLTNAAGESLPLLAAAVATRSPTVGAALMGGASGAQEYTDLRVDGIDRANAAQAGALTGAVEAAGEAVGLPAILGKTGRGSLARAALAEGAQEAPVQIAQTNIDDEARGQVTPVGEQLLGAVDAALVGGALGGAAHLAGGHRGGVDGQVSPAPEGNGDVPRGNALPPEALALPPPDRTGDHGVIHVGPDGAAVPATQAVQARHPGFPLEQMEPAAPNSQPFPGATPGSLADALNATTETAATSALVSDPGGASAAPVGSLADAASALPRSPATQEQRLAQIAMDANDARGRRQKERELDAIARESRLPAALQSADPFNWNSFQGRPIDSMGQERLPAEDRYTARTSAGAVALGRLTGSSPQKIEHLARGYFGWLGLQALNASDLMARDMLALGANPAHDFGKVDNLAVIGSFIKARDAGSSKYVQRFYDQQREVDMLYAAYAAARQAGDLERARELAGDDRLKLRGLYLAADREMTKVNRRIRQVTNDKRLSAEAKGELLGGLAQVRDALAERTTERAREIEAGLERAQ